MRLMRTTVTLEDDVAQRLKDLAHERGISFKRAINDAVRRGLEGGGGEPRPFVVKARKMGLKPGIDLSKANQLAAELEDAETLRKLRAGR